MRKREKEGKRERKVQTGDRRRRNFRKGRKVMERGERE